MSILHTTTDSFQGIGNKFWWSILHMFCSITTPNYPSLHHKAFTSMWLTPIKIRKNLLFSLSTPTPTVLIVYLLVVLTTVLAVGETLPDSFFKLKLGIPVNLNFNEINLYHIPKVNEE